MIASINMTEEEFRDGCDSSNGVCLECGEIQDGGCEPDAEKYECGSCEKHGVYGLEQALIMGRIEIVDEEDE